MDMTYCMPTNVYRSILPLLVAWNEPLSTNAGEKLVI